MVRNASWTHADGGRVLYYGIWNPRSALHLAETKEHSKRKSFGADAASEENSLKEREGKSKTVRAGKYTSNYIGAGKFRGWNTAGG